MYLIEYWTVDDRPEGERTSQGMVKLESKHEHPGPDVLEASALATQWLADLTPELRARICRYQVRWKGDPMELVSLGTDPEPVRSAAPAELAQEEATDGEVEEVTEV